MKAGSLQGKPVQRQDHCGLFSNLEVLHLFSLILLLFVTTQTIHFMIFMCKIITLTLKSEVCEPDETRHWPLKDKGYLNSTGCP